MQLRLARLCCVLLLAQLAQRASGQSTTNFTVTVFPSLASAPKAAYTPSVMGVNMGAPQLAARSSLSSLATHWLSASSLSYTHTAQATGTPQTPAGWRS